MQSLPNPHKHSRKKLILLTLIILVMILAVSSLGYNLVVQPKCLAVSPTYPAQMNQPTNDDLIHLVHSLGGHDPIQACSGDGLSGYTSIDGYRSYVIRIPGENQAKIETLGCPPHPQDDPSNGQKANYVHAAFRNHDTITGFYSPEGDKCHGGDIEAIVTTKDRENKSSVYVIFTARAKN